MVQAIEVAKYLLSYANDVGECITNLRLQKFLYYAQAWYLVNYKEPLFKEKIEAWKFGPVVRSVYGKWKNYQNRPIPYKSTGREKDSLDQKQRMFIEEFMRVYGRFSAAELVAMSHREEPWKNAYAQGENTIISLEEMKKYYSQLLKNEKK